jgi:hypothetical protein
MSATADRDAKIVDLIVALAALLPDLHRGTLKRRIAAL